MKSINDTTQKMVDTAGFELVCVLRDTLKEAGLTQTQLSEMTGIRQASINELVLNRRFAFNRLHIVAIMSALGTTDLSKVIKIVPKGGYENA